MPYRPKTEPSIRRVPGRGLRNQIESPILGDYEQAIEVLASTEVPVVGIAGFLGAGKSTIARALEAKFAYVRIDVDALGHKALASCAAQIRELFGPKVMTGEGEVDRKVLGSIVFSDSKERLKLEAVVHPWMRTELWRQIGILSETGKGLKKKGVIVDAALLFPMKLSVFCDLVLWVRAPLSVRLKRVVLRDKVSREAALVRLRGQAQLAPSKDASDYADILIVENREVRRTMRFLSEIWEQGTWTKKGSSS